MPPPGRPEVRCEWAHDAPPDVLDLIRCAAFTNGPSGVELVGMVARPSAGCDRRWIIGKQFVVAFAGR